MTASTLDAILPLVNRPGRYIGLELHAVSRPWDQAAIRFALVFPDLYEIGMSHQGLQILYHQINRHQDLLAERAYVPDRDMEERLRAAGLPLHALESRRPLTDFDVIGFTLPYELSYTNILTVLDLCGIPFRAQDRDGRHPLVIGGGSCGMNAEPVAPFFDAIALGDGEEMVLEMGEALAGAGPGRQERLDALATLPGLYLPDRHGPGGPPVRRRVLARLPGANAAAPPLVPVVRTVHDRLAVEVARGCTRGCRFCQAGIIYRPVRERPAADIMELAERGIAQGGYEELALLSLSTGDYSCIGPLMQALMHRFAADHVSVSMPSMRVGTLSPAIMEQIRRVRKTGFTLAPEAGTDRLRQVINKGITEEDLLETCASAFALGWKLLKFYFMIGLPTETREDVEAIVDLARRARAQAPRGRGVRINVSVGTFVPKPHTPFQWERQIDMDEARQRLDLLKKRLPRRGFKLKWHEPEQSFLEGVLARGDRALAGVIEAVWRDGARLEAWNEHFDLRRWLRAAEARGIDLRAYLAERPEEAPLPWDHLHSGVSRDFLLQERQRSRDRVYTPDCRNHACQGCGLCDFKTIRPRVHGSGPDGPLPGQPAPSAKESQGPGFLYRVDYTRLGDTRFFGHLEVVQLIFRALRRAGLPLVFSQGFNPRPRVSFSQPLPVGVESRCEFFDMELHRPLSRPREVAEQLGAQFPPGMEVRRVAPRKQARPGPLVQRFTITPPRPPDQRTEARLRDFLALDQVRIQRRRKGKVQDLDIRPLVRRLEVVEDAILMDLYVDPSRPSVAPAVVLEQALGLDREALAAARMVKTAQEETPLEVQPKA